MKFAGRMGGGMVISAIVWVRSTIRVGEMQFDGMTSKGMVMSAAVRVRSMVWVGGRGAELDRRTR